MKKHCWRDCIFEKYMDVQLVEWLITDYRFNQERPTIKNKIVTDNDNIIPDLASFTNNLTLYSNFGNSKLKHSDHTPVLDPTKLVINNDCPHAFSPGIQQRLYITRRVTSRFNMGRHFELIEHQGPSDWS